MTNNLEITKATLDDIKKIQKYMSLAKEENAIKTHAELKEEYTTLKALPSISGVNLNDVDYIKE